MIKVTKTGPLGIELIHSFETCVLKPYRCPAGVPTIGWGNTFYEDGTKVTMKDSPITQERADKLFEFILHDTEKYVDSYCIDTVSQNQFDALVSFAYNCGCPALKGSTLLKKVNRNLNDPAIRAEFAKWNKSSGRVLAGLVRRRKAEADLYFS
jgi:lysozyme